MIYGGVGHSVVVELAWTSFLGQLNFDWSWLWNETLWDLSFIKKKKGSGFKILQWVNLTYNSAYMRSWFIFAVQLLGKGFEKVF